MTCVVELIGMAQNVGDTGRGGELEGEGDGRRAADRAELVPSTLLANPGTKPSKFMRVLVLAYLYVRGQRERIHMH